MLSNPFEGRYDPLPPALAKRGFAQHLVHKTVLTFLAWLALGWMIYAYYIRRQRGTPLVVEMCAVFILLLMGYVLSNFILQFVINH